MPPSKPKTPTSQEKDKKQPKYIYKKVWGSASRNLNQMMYEPLKDNTGRLWVQFHSNYKGFQNPTYVYYNVPDKVALQLSEITSHPSFSFFNPRIRFSHAYAYTGPVTWPSE